MATPVAVEAEFHFRVTTKELGRSDVSWPQKAHIYIFEQPEDWKGFQSAGQLEQWTGGIQSRGSLFIVRNPAFKFTDNSLGHEVVHLVLYRLYGPGIPALAERRPRAIFFQGHASFQRARGPRRQPTSERVAAESYFRSTLATMSYPPADQVATFLRRIGAPRPFSRRDGQGEVYRVL